MHLFCCSNVLPYNNVGHHQQTHSLIEIILLAVCSKPFNEVSVRILPPWSFSSGNDKEICVDI